MRKLNYTEAAAAESNNLYPLTAVCILRLQNGPAENALTTALGNLLQAHPLLSAVITKRKGNYHFTDNNNPGPIPLRTVVRESDTHWLEIARRELNQGFSNSSSPLMRVVYLIATGADSISDLVLSFHHAVVDSVSIMEITSQLLSFCGETDNLDKNADQKHIHETFSPAAPASGNILPPSFRGIRLYFRLIPFFIRQAAEGIRYDLFSARPKDSKVPDSSENDIITIEFSTEETSELIRWARSRMISLNGLISAAMLAALNQYRYNCSRTLMRTIQFANLRPYLNPPVSANDDGCFVSSMRFTVPVDPHGSIERCAEDLDRQLLGSARRGEKFLSAVLSRFLIKKTISAHNIRLAETALSYAGPLPLKGRYGNIILGDVHGFITNNCLGPEFTAFAAIVSGKLNLDINFLPAEITRETALMMAGSIKKQLLELTESL